MNQEYPVYSIIIDGDIELGKQVQEFLFKLGYGWEYHGKKIITGSSLGSLQINYVAKGAISYANDPTWVYSIFEINNIFTNFKDFKLALLNGKKYKPYIPKWKDFYK